MKRELCELPLILPFNCNNRATYAIFTNGFNIKVCEGHLHVYVDYRFRQGDKKVEIFKSIGKAIRE